MKRRAKIAAALFLAAWIAHLAGPILLSRGYVDRVCRDTRFGWLCWTVERVEER